MEKLFQIATTISTPLALGGLFAVIFFFIIKQMLAKDVFPPLTKSSAFNILKTIVDRLFVLALIAMLLGFVGYIIPILLQAISSQKSLPQASSNELPKFRVRYFDVEGYAIDFLMKGMIDEKMENALSGHPYIVQNDVFKEIKLLREKFPDPFSTIFFLDDKKNKFEVDTNNKMSSQLSSSQELDFQVEADKSIINSVKNDLSWNLSWQDCSYIDNYLSDIKKGKIHANCFSFWKFAKNRKEIDIFSRRYSNKEIEYFHYITKEYFPPDFYIIHLGYPGCVSGWTLGFIRRVAVVRVALIENISNVAIKIGSFYTKSNKLIQLQEREKNAAITNNKDTKREMLFPIEILSAGERILIPIEVYFKYDKDSKIYLKNMYENNNFPETLIKNNNFYNISIVENWYTDNATNRMKNINYSSLLKLIKKEKHNPVIEKEFTYGPSVSIEQIEVDEKIYPFRKYDEKTFMLQAGMGVGSCPYAYTYSSETKQWLSEGHILYGKSSKRKEGWDSIKLKRFTGKVIIKENDPEVSFIELLRIRVKTDDGKEEVLLPKQSLLRSEDQQYLKMKQGEQIEVEFDGFQEKSGSTFYLESKGYYEVLGR